MRSGQRPQAGVRQLRPWRASSNEQGQVSLLIGMIMMTFILFFAFVVNTGMLVNAKINLQNAADLAAYAGAAVQARQLNEISYLNYEMRRQYKKFLFRYYVVGNMAQKTHPGNPQGSTSGPRRWGPTLAKQYGVPAVCVIFNSQDNFCQVDQLNPIKITSSSMIDTIHSTLNEELHKLEDIRVGNCLSIGRNNMRLVALWLFNTDPTLKNMEVNAGQPGSDTVTGGGGTTGNLGVASSLSILKGLAYGLGLVPREIILSQRIKTLQGYVNAAPQAGITQSKVNTFQGGVDPAEHERTIQAFLSAFNTLGPNTFQGEIQMDELLPKAGDGAKLLTLQKIESGFDVYGVQFKLRDAANGTVTTDQTPGHVYKCEPYLVPDPVPQLTVGYYKDPTVMTYYAVRLTAKAKVMFSPFGDMTLKAYAAAQPFGSRIGPKLDGKAFTRQASSDACGMNADPALMFKLSCQGYVPNLPVKENDSAGDGGVSGGWNMNDVISAMYNQFRTDTGGEAQGAMPVTLTPEIMDKAYQASMVPNPWEKGKYNVLSDTNDDAFVHNFEPTTHINAFWAPILPPSERNSSALKDAINQAVADNLKLLDPSGHEIEGAAQLKQLIVSGLNSYVDDLRAGKGENGEGFNVVRITDPYFTQPQAGLPATSIHLPPDIMMKDPADVKSSWDAVKDKNLAELGRVGYSVKIVPLRMLANGDPRIKTNGMDSTFTNLLPVDSSSEEIQNFVQH